MADRNPLQGTATYNDDEEFELSETEMNIQPFDLTMTTMLATTMARSQANRTTNEYNAILKELEQVSFKPGNTFTVGGDTFTIMDDGFSATVNGEAIVPFGTLSDMLPKEGTMTSTGGYAAYIAQLLQTTRRVRTPTVVSRRDKDRTSSVPSPLPDIAVTPEAKALQSESSTDLLTQISSQLWSMERSPRRRSDGSSEPASPGTTSLSSQAVTPKDSPLALNSPITRKETEVYAASPSPPPPPSATATKAKGVAPQPQKGKPPVATGTAAKQPPPKPSQVVKAAPIPKKSAPKTVTRTAANTTATSGAALAGSPSKSTGTHSSTTGTTTGQKKVASPVTASSPTPRRSSSTSTKKSGQLNEKEVQRKLRSLKKSS